MDNFIIKKTKRAKSMSIKVSHNGEVLVYVPNVATDDEILSFINRHKKWIDSKLDKINKLLNDNNEIINYKKIYFLGKKYPVIYVDGLNQITFHNSELFVPSKYKSNISKYIKDWYLQYFNEIVVTKTNLLTKKLNLNYNSISAINSVRRWGSCTSTKKISYNYKILMLDINLINYVITHEVCHLIEMNHQKKFWNCVSRILPNYMNLKKELKNYGFLLRI